MTDSRTRDRSVVAANDGFGTGRRVLVIAALLSLAALIWDRHATAAEPKRLLFALVTGGWTAFAVLYSTRERDARTSPARTAAAAFVAFSALSCTWGSAVGLREISPWISGAALAWLLARQRVTDVIRMARTTALVIGGVSSWLAFVEFLRAGPSMRAFAAHGGHGNPNWLGLVLAVTLPLSLDACCARRPPDASQRARALGVLRWVLTAGQPIALYVSHARVAWAATAVALLLLAWATRGRARIAALVLALAISAWWLRTPATIRSPSELDAPIVTALRGRLWIAQVSAHAARSALPLGAGVGRFTHAFLDAQGSMLAGLPVRQAAHQFLHATTAHDDWLQALVESGPIGLALLLATFALSMRALLAMRWLGGAASVLATAVCAFGDSPLRQPAVVVLLAVVLGALGRGRRRADASSPSRRFARAAGFALLAAHALLVPELLRGWLATHIRARGLEAPIDERIASASRAARLDPRNADAALDVGWMLVANGDGALGLRSLQRAWELSPSVGTELGIAETEQRLGQVAEARRDSAKAVFHHPGSFRARVQEARLLLQDGLLSDAARDVQAARALMPGDRVVQDLEESLARARVDQGSSP